MKIGIVAGEASGDLLGAALIEAIKARFPEASIEGMGGPAMQAAGCTTLFDSERLAVMGFVEPLMRLPDLIRLRRDIVTHFTTHQPDLFIGIDSPDFNLGLEIKLRATGIPVVHYVSPSVWAWRQGRIKKIARAVDLMLTLLPFEAKFYEQHKVPVMYVGHPLARQIPREPDVQAARASLQLPKNATVIALLPGSRAQEIKHMATPFLLAAKLLHEQNPHLQFITSHINEARYQAFYEAYQRIAPDLPLTFYLRKSSEVMAAADVVVVTSGTATLEVMLHKKPMVIAYRMSRLTHWLAKWLVKTKHVGLPNLLADERLVPELIQEAATPEAIAEHVRYALDHPQYVQALQARFDALHEVLAEDNTAALITRLAELMAVR